MSNLGQRSHIYLTKISNTVTSLTISVLVCSSTNGKYFDYRVTLML